RRTHHDELPVCSHAVSTGPVRDRPQKVQASAVLAPTRPLGTKGKSCPGTALAFGRVCNFHTGYAKTSRPSEIRLRRRSSHTKETFAADLCRSEPIAILCCTAADRFLPVLRHLPSAPRPGMQSVAARSYPGFSPVALWYRW